ncbi:putative reverse transcriptase domain-containing protein [Tanacetum coccineum]
MVNGTFLINNVYASVLFDTGADRSFVSYAFSKYIDIHPTTLDTNYSVELADGKSLTTTTILRGCTLNLKNHLFKIDLLPLELGSFDVIVGMDWMAKHRAKFVCYEKYIRVPYGNDMLIIQGERRGVKNESRLEVISSIRTQKYIDQGCQVFLIQMTKEEETEIPERRVEDVLVVRDFPKANRKQSVGESSSQKKSLKITIRQKQVDGGEKDEQSYNDVDDSDNRLEPGSHKKNPEHVNDDDDKEEEKVDEKEGDEMGSLETRTEEMQTIIPTTPRSLRKILSSDKNIDPLPPCHYI